LLFCLHAGALLFIPSALPPNRLGLANIVCSGMKICQGCVPLLHTSSYMGKGLLQCTAAHVHIEAHPAMPGMCMTAT